MSNFISNIWIILQHFNWTTLLQNIILHIDHHQQMQIYFNIVQHLETSLKSTLQLLNQTSNINKPW